MMPVYLVVHAWGQKLCKATCVCCNPPTTATAPPPISLTPIILTALHTHVSRYSCHALSLDYQHGTQHCRWPTSLLWKQSPSSWSPSRASTQIQCWCWTSSPYTPLSSSPTTCATAQWWAALPTLQQPARKSSWELPTMLFPQAPSLGSMLLTSERANVALPV